MSTPVSTSVTSTTTGLSFPSPLLMYPSDNPGCVLVTQPLDGSNYSSWKCAMRLALGAKNKCSFIDGIVDRPDPTTDPTSTVAWDQCDRIVMSWICNSLVKKLQGTVLYAKNARQLWLELENRFAQGDGPRIFELKRQISLLHHDALSVSEYFTSLKNLWDELDSYIPVPKCSCGYLVKCTGDIMKKLVDQAQTEQVFQFLLGLTDAFSTVRTQILIMSPLPSIAKAYSLVLQEERQRGLCISHVSSENIACVVNKGYSEYSRTGGHFSQSYNTPAHTFSSSDSRNGSRRPLCSHCHKYGHTKDTCFDIHGFPPNFGRKPPRYNRSQSPVPQLHLATESTVQSDGEVQHDAHMSPAATTSPVSPLPPLSQSQYQQLISFLNGSQPNANFGGMNLCLRSTVSSLHSWVIDSGASHHFSSSHSPSSYAVSPTAHPPVLLPDGSKYSISSVGTHNISPHIQLQNVYHIPKFAFNLLSVSQITKHLNYSVTCFPTFCIFQDLSTKMVTGVGLLGNGLYRYESSPSTVALSVSPEMWHFRLGHPSPHTTHIPSLQYYTGVCDVCPLAKHTCSPFPTCNSHSTHPFALIHCDIWGPYSTLSYTGCKYFLTLMDDYTRTTWVFLMKYKSDTFIMLSHFFSMVATQFSTTVKIIRSDNGTEFLSSSIQNLLHSLGILHQRTCVYTPQQNGVVERKHRHLLQVARSFRFQANLPLHFWGECVLTACYIINCLPITVLCGKSPYEMLFHKTPTYTYLRTFGSLCYARTHSPHQHKFSARSTPCIFVGYPSNQKGYKVYDLASHTIFISRDVQFLKA
ncbi:hypothetical protein NE237_021097 [Protea cynaroides]|uniref:Integrase catalytic domain-containing protein n=1 Tax=Protea cynaroides TaxID=273540 RepID=A0A9Q0K374_9MAGN|nr:hypothetical protein NE237_021097 [Protea cynaroides]